VTPDPVPGDVAAALSRAGLPPVLFFAEIDSTNTRALGLAEAGAPEFSAVLADVQHAGRGRRGRDWFSPAGAGMYLSVIVRGHGLEAHLPVLTLAAGVAVADAIQEVSGLPVELKWPNDLVIGRPWRKLGGILCEAASLGTPDAAVVVGIGLNLEPAAYPPALAGRATALASECDRPVARGDVVAACLLQLRAQVAHLREGRRAAVLDRWRQLAQVGLDEALVRWQDERGACRGIAYGVDGEGALLVRRAGPVTSGPGELGRERLIAGDVVWERLSRD